MQPVVTAPAKLTTRAAFRRSLWHVLSTATPIIMLSIFTIVHVRHWVVTGEFIGLGFAIQESVLILLFLLRRQPKESLNSVGAWTAALIGSWGVLLVRPNGFAVLDAESLFIVLQLVGAALSIIATIYLGRSFGIVAANRGIKTEGAYRIVRHPIYATYIIGLLGYVLSSMSVWNIAVIVISLSFQVRRIYAEESVLKRDPQYRAYAERVRYRLVPYVW